MAYAVKEIFYTLQGEGANTGRPAVFVRFSGCNLWSGREADRAGARCRFCDTDFVGCDGAGGGDYAAADLADRVARAWPGPREGTGNGVERPDPGRPFVVCTGGEPLLQVDAPLIAALKERGFEVAIETNGSIAVPPGIDWVCVSPKAGAETIVRQGDELKFVFPQLGAEPANFEPWAFKHFFLQPLDGPDRLRNTELATAYCLAHPRWRLSLQVHKLIGLP